MAQSPLSVRSWSGAAEWLPDVMYEVSGEALLKELEGRPASVWARTGYLVQGFRPDAAKAIGDAFSPKSKVRFGGRGKATRNDERWLVSDTILPFDPREMEAVR